MITQTELKELMTYDPETGEFRWIEDKYIGRSKNKRWPVAGCVNRKLGYLVIRFDGKLYYAHRLAWLYMTGKWPKNQIDHINGNKLDNRWSNIREATSAQNQMNSPVKNKFGLKGIYKNKKRFGVAIRHNNKRIYLGTYDTPEEAHEVYWEKAQELFGEYARVS